jgi:8-oxo-dGTP diphosphatase
VRTYRNFGTVNEALAEVADLQKNPTMTVVAAALIDGSGRVLLQQRAPGRAMAGLWEFPGGKVEEGELPEAALVRELDEELGIEVDAAALVPACFASAPVAGRHMILLLYLCRSWHGEPQALDASALGWLRPADMVAAEMPPADRPLIGLLEALL